jgi:hypothetical protein
LYLTSSRPCPVQRPHPLPTFVIVTIDKDISGKSQEFRDFSPTGMQPQNSYQRWRTTSGTLRILIRVVKDKNNRRQDKNQIKKIFLPSGKHRVAHRYSMFSFIRTLPYRCHRGCWSAHAESLPWHFLYFLPLPHGQGSFRPTFGCSRRICLTFCSP